MNYKLTESAKNKYSMVLGVLLLSGVLPMTIAGLIITVLGF